MNNLIKQIVESKFNFNIDVDNNESKNSLSKSSFNSKSLKVLYEESLNIIDLGLPSGTLWCKYNLGVNPNVLTEPENWYGNYYAWGETETKDKYTWETYKHCTPDYDPLENENEGSLTKYTADVFIDSDGKTVLEAEDDAAYQNMHYYNFKFHIPTKEELEELIALSNEWVKNYNGVSGLNGRVFTGTNGNTLFIPAAGNYVWISPYGLAGSNGFLWSSSLNPNNHVERAWNLLICSTYACLSCYFIESFRCNGFPIRPVSNKFIN